MDVLAYFKEVLSSDEYQQLIRSVQVKKGSYVYIPPHKPGEMFLLDKGVVKIGTYTEDGTEVCYDILYRNEVFGNLRYLNGQFFEYAKALTDCSLFCIDLNFYKRMIVHDPTISDWFNRSTIQRWCRMETRLFKICTLSPIGRLRALLGEFEGEVSDAKGTMLPIQSLLTSVDISQMSGLSRQTVSKLLKSIENAHNRSKKRTFKIIPPTKSSSHVS